MYSDSKVVGRHCEGAILRWREGCEMIELLIDGIEAFGELVSVDTVRENLDRLFILGGLTSSTTSTSGLVFDEKARLWNELN
jgi:hypothetical protein